MRSSATLAKLAPALVKAQHDFRIIERTTDGQAGNRTYKYATLTDVLEGVRDTLHANGLSVVQLPSIAPDGKHVLSTMILHESGEFIEGEMDLGAGTGSQALGSAITYARRYSLSGALRLSIDDDDDGAGNGGGKQRADVLALVAEMPKVSEDPSARRKFVLDTLKVYPEEVPSYDALTPEQVATVRAAIRELELRPA